MLVGTVFVLYRPAPRSEERRANSRVFLLRIRAAINFPPQAKTAHARTGGNVENIWTRKQQIQQRKRAEEGKTIGFFLRIASVRRRRNIIIVSVIIIRPLPASDRAECKNPPPK